MSASLFMAIQLLLDYALLIWWHIIHIRLLRYINSILQFVYYTLFQNFIIDVLMDGLMYTIMIQIFEGWANGFVYNYDNALWINMRIPIAVDWWVIYYIIFGCSMVSNSHICFDVSGCRRISLVRNRLETENWITVLI